AVDGQRSVAVDDLSQALPSDILEDQIVGAVVEPPEVGGPSHVRVLDASRGHRLPLEALHHLLDGGHLRVQELDGHGLSHVDVLAAVHHAHTALAEQLVEAITVGQHLAHAALRTRTTALHLSGTTTVSEKFELE